jgi:hypothetical protein
MIILIMIIVIIIIVISIIITIIIIAVGLQTASLPRVGSINDERTRR